MKIIKLVFFYSCKVAVLQVFFFISFFRIFQVFHNEHLLLFITII